MADRGSPTPWPGTDRHSANPARSNQARNGQPTRCSRCRCRSPAAPTRSSVRSSPNACSDSLVSPPPPSPHAQRPSPARASAQQGCRSGTSSGPMALSPARRCGAAWPCERIHSSHRSTARWAVTDMRRDVEVFADVRCPFTHVGLRRFVARRRLSSPSTDNVSLVVRAWPLELVNGAPLDARMISQKVSALRHQVAPTLFRGFDEDAFPATSMPALILEAAARRQLRRNRRTGEPHPARSPVRTRPRHRCARCPARDHSELRRRRPELGCRQGHRRLAGGTGNEVSSGRLTSSPPPECFASVHELVLRTRWDGGQTTARSGGLRGRSCMMRCARQGPHRAGAGPVPVVEGCGQLGSRRYRSTVPTARAATT